MKIEGTTNPLPTTRIAGRSAESVDSASAADDAVYFEPEDKRREKKEREGQGPKKEELAAEVEVSVDGELEAKRVAPIVAEASADTQKVAPRVVDVLA